MSHSWDALELPMAGVCLAAGGLSVVWKSIGVGWIPALGPAINVMFKGTPDGLYPRRGTLPDGTTGADEGSYRALYFLMYGVLGTAGTLAGWRLSKSLRHLKVKEKETKGSPAALGAANANRARLYGAFHLAIGVHHVLYALSRSGYGKLELHRVGLGDKAGYVSTGITALLCIRSSVKLLFQTSATSAAGPVLKLKTVLDTVSVWTLFGMVIFIPNIIAGNQLSRAMVEATWKVNMLALPMIFVAGEVL